MDVSEIRPMIPHPRAARRAAASPRPRRPVLLGADGAVASLDRPLVVEVNGARRAACAPELCESDQNGASRLATRFALRISESANRRALLRQHLFRFRLAKPREFEENSRSVASQSLVGTGRRT